MAPSEARRRSRRSQNRPNKPRKARRLGHHGAVRHPSATYRYSAVYVYAGRAAEPNARVTATQLAGVQQQPAKSEHEAADFLGPHDIGRTNTRLRMFSARSALGQRAKHQLKRHVLVYTA
ncbi:hypothetical protein HDV63DRAFT_375877 [Trichoderma sp. SZMC 28014]